MILGIEDFDANLEVRYFHLSMVRYIRGNAVQTEGNVIVEFVLG